MAGGEEEGGGGGPQYRGDWFLNNTGGSHDVPSSCGSSCRIRRSRVPKASGMGSALPSNLQCSAQTTHVPRGGTLHEQGSRADSDAFRVGRCIYVHAKATSCSCIMFAPARNQCECQPSPASKVASSMYTRMAHSKMPSRFQG